MSEPDQIDIPASKARSLGLVAMGLCFVGGCLAFIVYVRTPPGDFAVFAMYAGIALGLVGVGGGLRGLLRRGPVVSVGRRGIFDRRVSRDWIPWDAVGSLAVATVQGQSFVMLKPHPDRDASLSITTFARRLARVNAKLGFDGYAIAGTNLVGGFAAVQSAIAAWAEASGAFSRADGGP